MPLRSAACLLVAALLCCRTPALRAGTSNSLLDVSPDGTRLLDRPLHVLDRRPQVPHPEAAAPDHGQRRDDRAAEEPAEPGRYAPGPGEAGAATDVADRLRTDRAVVDERTDRAVPATGTSLGHEGPGERGRQCFQWTLQPRNGRAGCRTRTAYNPASVRAWLAAQHTARAGRVKRVERLAARLGRPSPAATGPYGLP